MTQHGKKYKENLGKVDREQLYGVADAVELEFSQVAKL